MKIGVDAATPGNVHYRDLAIFKVVTSRKVVEMVLPEIKKKQKKMTCSSVLCSCLSQPCDCKGEHRRIFRSNF